MELGDMDQEYIIIFNRVSKGLQVILLSGIDKGDGKLCKDCMITATGDKTQPS